MKRLTLSRVSLGLLLSLVLSWGAAATFEQVASSQTAAPAVNVHGHGLYPTGAGMIFVAVLGSDARTGPPSTQGGCDAIHILAINSATMQGTVLNVPRDSYISGKKITDICRQGGFTQGMATLSSYTGIPIGYYAYTDFSNFMSLMNQIGGLNIQVYPGTDNGLHNVANTGANFNPGQYHMLGGDLLAFARDRDDAPDGDLGRSTDQAQIIMSGFRMFSTTAADMSYVLKLIYDGRQFVSFNVPLPNLIQLALIARQIPPANVSSCTLLGTPTTIGGASVVVLASSNQAIFRQVAASGTLPAGAQCTLGVNGEIPPTS